MRAIVLAVWLTVRLTGCTLSGANQRPSAPVRPTGDMMPSAVLDHQDPGADTSRNPERSRSSSRSLFGDLLGGLFSWHGPSPGFGGPAETPHYYRGCGGCSTDGPDGALLLGLLVLATASRSCRSRRSRRSRRP